MKIIGEGNVTKAELELILSEAEIKRYTDGKCTLEEMSRLYKYKKAKEKLGFAREVSARRAYTRLPVSVVDKINSEELYELIELYIKAGGI